VGTHDAPSVAPPPPVPPAPVVVVVVVVVEETVELVAVDAVLDVVVAPLGPGPPVSLLLIPQPTASQEPAKIADAKRVTSC
jgi:hypothetical protein